VTTRTRTNLAAVYLTLETVGRVKRRRSLSTPDHPQEKDHDPCTAGGYEHRSRKPAGNNTVGSQQQSANHRADSDIPDSTEPASLYQNAGQPSGNEPNKKDPAQSAHGMLSVVSFRVAGTRPVKNWATPRPGRPRVFATQKTICSNLPMLFPGHQPPQNQARDSGAADGIIGFFMKNVSVA